MKHHTSIPHAFDRLADWIRAWHGSGRLVLLLDFDGTLAPIVERPELATLPRRTAGALERLSSSPGVELAIVSGRALADVRERVGIPGLVHAGNHGLEVSGPGTSWVHDGALQARPRLEEVMSSLRPLLARVEGAQLEDKWLTLTVHLRRVARAEVSRVHEMVLRVTRSREGLRVTRGKEILEIRPAVEWDKGCTVEALLALLELPPGVPVVYIGDDLTDEDAFRALRAQSREPGAGVLVGEAPLRDTAATAFLGNPLEVAELLARIVDQAPS